jgi:hypothetical protein
MFHQKYAFAALVAMLMNTVAGACTCFNEGSHGSQVRGAFEAADAVFAARVRAVSERESQDGREATAEMEVLEVWKGPMRSGETVPVGVAPTTGGLSCLYEVKVGDELMIYVYGPPYQLIVCSMSGPLPAGASDRTLLDKLRDRDTRRRASKAEAATTSLPSARP